MKRPAHTSQVAVREALRRATSGTHERMHGLKPFTLIEKGLLYREAYADLVEGLYRFHAQVGTVASKQGLSRFSNASRKISLLTKDLATLARSPPELDCTLTLPCDEHVLGSLYVAEGSMFGGKVLARQLDYLFGKEAAGRLFFLGSIDDQAQWRLLVTELETRADHPNAISDMAMGAEITFRHFESCVTAFEKTRVRLAMLDQSASTSAF